jgi:hypothetical protein
MKYLLFVLIAAAAILALDQGPMDAIPYCLPVTNGRFTDNLSEYNSVDSYNEGFAWAIYRNGENLGLNMEGYDYFYTNETFYDVGIGALWDFGSDYWSVASGVGVTDGTYDTYDGAMSLSFDDVTYGIVNLTTICVGDTGFSMMVDIPNGLRVLRTFYVPQGNLSEYVK